MSKTAEKWRPVDGYEGYYEVSCSGKVRSLDREVQDGRGNLRKISGKVLRTVKDVHGYLKLALFKDGKRKVTKVHQIVAKAFLEKDPDKNMVCHKNGNPADNRVENLYWGTMSENILDSVRHGTHGMSRKTHCRRGQEYTPENTYQINGTGRRYCRACVAIRSRIYREGKRK